MAFLVSLLGDYLCKVRRVQDLELQDRLLVRGITSIRLYDVVKLILIGCLYKSIFKICYFFIFRRCGLLFSLLWIIVMILYKILMQLGEDLEVEGGIIVCADYI